MRSKHNVFLALTQTMKKELSVGSETLTNQRAERAVTLGVTSALQAWSLQRVEPCISFDFAQGPTFGVLDRHGWCEKNTC